MDDRMLTSFRLFLIAWIGLVLAHFTYVQSRTDWGASALAWDPTNLWHPIYFGLIIATFVIVPFVVFHIPVARRFGGSSSAAGRAILLFGIGVVLWGLGNGYWFIQNVRGTEAPYPSLADAGYLAVLPFAALALWQLSKLVGLTKADWRWLPLSLLIAFPINAYIMLPQGIGAGTFDTPLQAAISTTYIVSDVTLLGVGILVAVGARRAAGGRMFAPVLGVVASVAMLYVGDLLFNYRIANDQFYNADVSDLLFGSFIVTSSIATWLFLRADVQAAADAARADAAWDPARSLSSSSDHLDEHLDVRPLDALATAIVASQQRVMGGQTAYTVAGTVAGIAVAGDGTSTASNLDAVDALVRAYRSLSGPLGEMASWTAARPVIDRYPELQVASFARFATAGQAPTHAA